jgi:hypothetical protein
MSSNFMPRNTTLLSRAALLSFISQRRGGLSGFNSTFELQLGLALYFKPRCQPRLWNSDSGQKSKVSRNVLGRDRKSWTGMITLSDRRRTVPMLETPTFHRMNLTELWPQIHSKNHYLAPARVGVEVVKPATSPLQGMRGNEEMGRVNCFENTFDFRNKRC